MLRGGSLGGSYHMHQIGSLSEPPLSPTTSSSQGRTMPFLVTTRCAESSVQLSSGTSGGSPFTFTPGDGFLSPALDLKQQPENRQQVPATTTVCTFFPSPRQEILLKDESLSSTPAQDVAQQMLIRGSSFQSAGADTNKSQSSGTSAGSSQLSNGGRDGGTGVPEKEFAYNQLHTATSTADEGLRTENGAEPSNDRAAEEWDGHQESSVVITEHSMVPQDVRNEEIGPEAGSQELGSTRNQQHQLGSAPAPYLSERMTKEEQHSKFNQQQPSELGNVIDSAAESVPTYAAENSVAQSNVSEIFPPYSTNLMLSDSYNFPTGAELLGVPPQLRHSSSGHPSSGSDPNGVPDESGGPFGHIGALYANQNLVGRLGYTTSPSLKGTWMNVASPYANSSLLDGNHVHSNLQAMSPLVGTPVSTLLSDGLQDNPYSQGEPPNREGTSYFSSQQVQTVDAMQLCLNPGFGGPNSDSGPSVATPGNLVLMSHSAVDQLNGSHNQHHFLSIPVPTAGLAQSALSQSSQLLGHEGIHSPVPGQNMVGNQGYNNWRNGGNELLFLPGSDPTVHNQPFTGQMSDQVQGAELGMSQYGSRRSPSLSAINQLHQHSIFQNGDGQELPSAGIGNCQLQGLSLSLSSQQPSALQLQLPNHGRTHEADIDVFAVMSQASVEAKGKRVECTEGRYNGILSRFRHQREDHDLEMSAAAHRLHNYGQSGEGQHSVLINPSTDPFTTSSSNTSYGSNATKYLKLCQILLSEICVVRKCERRAINHDLRPQRANWSADQPSSVSASNAFTSFHASRDAESTRKDFINGVAALPGSSSSLIAETSRAHEPLLPTNVQPDSREDLEKKKLRLGSYLEEVDRRYRAYLAHMMDIITQFNSLSGPEAATPYTALALQAMSRHFRCLRDAVSGQLRAVKRALGEQDTSPGYAGRDLSSLPFVDQQLRQQRTLQQLGMLQQHAWRPQRGLPERAVSVLRSWLFEHFLHPYPKDSDKLFLAKQTGLTRSQVSNWFINARVRLWKPMVEEMYMEEFSNSDEGGSGERKQSRERRRESESAMDYDDGTIASSFSNGHADTGAQTQHQRITIPCRADGMFDTQSNHRSAHGSTQNAPTSSSLGFDADQRGGVLKKPRSSGHTHPEQLGPPIATMEIDPDSPGPFHDPCRLDGTYGNSADQDYSQHQDILADANGGRFGAYLGGNLTGYPGGSFISRTTTSTNGGVSLTLGLRHSDGLSLPGAAAAHQTYSNQGHPNLPRPKDHFESRGQDGIVRNMGDVHSELPLSHLNPGQEDLKQRNRLTSHLLHEFVAQG